MEEEATKSSLDAPPCYAHWVSASQEGGCNFCCEREAKKVWRIASRDPMRTLSVRLCPKCRNAIFEHNRGNDHPPR